jgi:pimeloyl-ACP methyl ester carboxylesterase
MALVTGKMEPITCGSAGLVAAKRLAAGGARVAVNGLRGDRVEEAAAELGWGTSGLVGDVVGSSRIETSLQGPSAALRKRRHTERPYRRRLSSPKPLMTKVSFAFMAAALLAVSTPAQAQEPSYPAEFRTQEIEANGVTIHVRIAGSGPAVVLIHGFGESGDMWAPLAARLVRNHTVIVPDLRGMGRSSKPAGGFSKMNQATDIAALMDALKIVQSDVVAHDIGNMVAFAFAEKYPNRVTKLVVIDAPIPGIGPWDEIARSPATWHFRFGGPDIERLVRGRERIYLDRFWNEFSADPARFPEQSRSQYAALYALPGAMHSVFEQYRAFDQDADDNRVWAVAHGKLAIPVLALGAEKGLGMQMGDIMRAAASDVTTEVIPSSGHWVMQENPAATVRLVQAFIDKP